MSIKVSEIAPLDLTLDEVIAFWAGKNPDSPALEYNSPASVEILSWAQFENYVQGMAKEIKQALAKGEVAGLVCDDSLHLHILINALWRCGIAVLLINRTWGVQVVEDLLKLTKCKVIYSNRKLDIERHPNFNVMQFPELHQNSSMHIDVKGNPDNVAIYATTSGTTDNPKCVPITHRKIRTAYRSCFAVRDFSNVRKSACLFQLNGIGVMGVCFLLAREIGASTCVFPPFSITNITSSWEKLLREKIDFVYLVPALVRLLNCLNVSVDKPSKLMAFCAAAPVETEDLQTLENKYPLTVYNAYGLTELTFAVFFGIRDKNGQATNSIGYPLGIEARIVTDDGIVLNGPAVGELYVRGPMLTEGYLNNPKATAEMWDGGWLKTGDIAERSADGRYFICGRIKDVVIRGGVLYYLHELEYYLRRSPVVIDVCAFKGLDLPSGDELCVVIHVRKTITHSEILDWMRTNIGEEKIPNVLIIWQRELPRNSNGKVMRKALSAMYLSGQLRDILD